MPRNTIRAAAGFLLAALLISAIAPVAAGAASPDRTARRVVVVLAPYLTWDDIMKGPMPETRALADRGLVANAMVRSGAVGGGPASITRGAVMLSAGASALSEPTAFAAYSASEPVGAYTAADIYRQVYGRAAGGSSVLYLGTPKQLAANARTLLYPRIGALGDAVRERGGLTAAVGNSDPGIESLPQERSRPAGIIAADASGRVLAGDVSAGLLTEDRSAPFGVVSDLAALERALDALPPSERGSLVVLDPGDLARAYAFSSQSTTATAGAAYRSALKGTDRMVRAAVRYAGADGMVIVFAPVVPEVQDLPPAFAPLIVSGAGSGLGTAASTHREGVVTLQDVSVTIVEAFGSKRPVEMVGSPIVPVGGAPSDLAARTDLLTRLNGTAQAVETVRLDTVNWYITVAVVVLLAATLLLFRGAPDVPARVRAGVHALLLLVPCVPLAAMLVFAVWRYPQSGWAVLGLLLFVVVPVWWAAMRAGRGRPPAVPLIVIAAATTIVLLLDQWIGAPLSFAGLFGYSPLFGARYYGIGNEMAGLLMGSTLVALALALDTWRDAAWAAPARRWGWPAVGIVVIATSAAPFLGANVGTIAWMTVGFLAGWWILRGRKVWTWRNAVVVVVLVAVLVAGFAAIDLLRGAGSATHLGRSISDAGSGGGVAGLWAIVARKAETNARVLGRTNWTWMLVATLAVLGYMRWRPRGEFAQMLTQYPAFSAALAAALFAGTVGYFTEDSGIIIPALLMLPVGVAALYLMMARPDGGEAS